MTKPKGLRDCELIVCCGSGGVGKTTTSAAIGLHRAVTAEQRVLVLTIDPARRLATALGIPDTGNAPARVTPALLRRAGIEVQGELWVAMLDAKSTWDQMVERYSPDAATARAIMANRFYRSISDAFVGSQEYMAMEALYEFHRAGEFDCIVLDTPPSRNALDFIEAPSRVSDFVGAKVLGWLSGGTRFGFRALDIAASPMLRIAGRVLGAESLEELREFATLLRGMYDGIQKRGKQVYQLLRSSETCFVVVITLEPGAFTEGEFFTRKLREFGMPLGLVVVNRVLPPWLLDKSAFGAATTMTEDPDVAAWLNDNCDMRVEQQDVRDLGDAFLTYYRLANRDARQMRKLARLGKVPVITVPLLSEGVSNLRGLRQIAELL